MISRGPSLFSYSRWEYSGLSVKRDGGTMCAEVTLKNAGGVLGAEIVQVYASGAKVPG